MPSPLITIAVTSLLFSISLMSHADQQAVKVAPIEYDYVDHTVRTFGVLAPRVEEISFSIAGRIKQFHVQEGDRVQTNQLIVDLEADDARDALSQAQNVLNKAQRILDRMSTLQTKGSIQISQLEDARDQYREAEISYNAAQLALDRCYLRSRSDGTILKQRIDSRTSVSPGESIFVFQSDDEPWVTKVELIDKNALMMSSDATAEVYFAPYPGEMFTGRVSRVAKVANPKDGLYTAEVTITPKGFTLWPGMVAELELHKKSAQKYYIVPLDAVLDLKGKRGKIYLASQNRSVAVEKSITINNVQNEFVSLVEDLGGYSEVITHGHHGLQDQSSIKIYD